MAEEQLPTTVNTAEHLPATFTDDSYDAMTKNDIIFPRLGIGQPTSPKVIDGIVKMATVFDSMSHTQICSQDEAVTMLPMMFWKDWIEWNPDRNVPKELRILNRSLDPNSDLAKISERREKVRDPKGKEVNRVTESYNVILCFPEKFGYEQLFLWSLNRSAYMPAKMMINAARMLKCKHPDTGQIISAPFWDVCWTLGIKKENKEGNIYFIPTFKSPIAINDKETFMYQYNRYKTLLEMKETIQKVNKDDGEDSTQHPSATDIGEV